MSDVALGVGWLSDVSEGDCGGVMPMISVPGLWVRKPTNKHRKLLSVIKGRVIWSKTIIILFYSFRISAQWQILI